MGERALDRIMVRDLQVRCVIGIYPEERTNKQDVLINLTLYADLGRACVSDNIDDTVDYKHVKKRVLAMAEESSFFLVERLAGRIAEICLEETGVERVDVSVDKPGALRFARSVAVSITRERCDVS